MLRISLQQSLSHLKTLSAWLVLARTASCRPQGNLYSTCGGIQCLQTDSSAKNPCTEQIKYADIS